MKLQHIKKQLLTVALTTVAMGAMAQSLTRHITLKTISSVTI